MKNYIIKFSVLVSIIFLSACKTKKQKVHDPDFPRLENPFFGQKPPGLIPEVFAPRIVSTEHSELAAAFSPDLKDIYFRRSDEELKEHSLVAIQYKDILWAESFVLPVRGEVAPDGKIMHLGNEYRERTSSGWSELKSLGAPFDSIPIMRLTTSSKGTYYFDTSPFYDKSSRVGTISYSRLIDGIREKPRTLDIIDMGTRKVHPFIAPDESYLIWDAQREDGYGSADMYISFRQKDGSWCAAINLGDKINTEHSDRYGNVTSDGKYFFFTRFHSNGKKNTMWVDAGFIEALRPLQSSSEESNTDTTIDLIKKVETGLIPRVYIEGDLTWSIEERMEHYGIPGVSIAVIHNGEIAWTKGYGVVDKESKAPVTEQTLFQAAATSMPVTAYGALRLVEQNKVGLDENINSYLKSWRLPDNEFTKEKKVTIRNLLNHSAGIHPRETGSYSINEKIPTLVEILSGTSPAINEPITVNKEPDESVRFAYASYVPIQQMILDVEGKTFPEIMHELVLQPLEMNNSTFNQSLTTEQLTKVATGYLQDGSMVKGRRYINPSMASNGLWTTAEDYAKFITNIQQTLEGKSTKGLSKGLTKLMGTPYGVSNSGWSFTLGLGFQLYNRNGEIYLRHHGWNRGFYAEIVAHRDKGYGVVVMTNSTFPAFNAEVIRSVSLIYEWDNYVQVYKKKELKYFLNGNFEKALDTYRNLMKQDLNNPTIREVNLNDLGYRFLSNDQTSVAHDVFKVNTILYPESANVYDSYAEVCKVMGKTNLAILNYSKSLELNPQNNNAKNMLKALQKNE